MAINETLSVTASFMTASGLALSKTSDVVTIVDTFPGPETYDIYVDQNRGGVSTFKDGYYQKGPSSLYSLFKEQHPTAIIKDGDIFNLRVAANTAIVGSSLPAKNYFSAEEIKKAKINLDVISYWPDIMYNNSASSGGDGFDTLYYFGFKHSEGQHIRHDIDEIVDFKGCYGKMQLYVWSLHASKHNYRFMIYNADGSVDSDVVYLTNGRETNTVYLNVKKGQYGRVIATYVPGGVDSKNNTFCAFTISAYSGGLQTALLMSGMYFNETHTINLYNDGLIIGHGGDAINYTPGPYSGDAWNAEVPPGYVDDYPRTSTGGDAVTCTDVKALNIYNNGTIAGGGGASMYAYQRVYNDNKYTPGDGGAPYGRRGVTWTATNPNVAGGVVAPIIFGKDGGFKTPGSSNAGAWGFKGKDPTQGIYNFKPGFYFRGSSMMLNRFGEGTYLGLHAGITEIP